MDTVRTFGGVLSAKRKAMVAGHEKFADEVWVDVKSLFRNEEEGEAESV